jgi:hypothetical protein
VAAPVLVLRDVELRVGAVRAVARASLTLLPGEAALVLAHDRRALRALLRCAAGRLAPTAGEVRRARVAALVPGGAARTAGRRGVAEPAPAGGVALARPVLRVADLGRCDGEPLAARVVARLAAGLADGALLVCATVAAAEATAHTVAALVRAATAPAGACGVHLAAPRLSLWRLDAARLHPVLAVRVTGAVRRTAAPGMTRSSVDPPSGHS